MTFGMYALIVSNSYFSPDHILSVMLMRIVKIMYIKAKYLFFARLLDKR